MPSPFAPSLPPELIDLILTYCEPPFACYAAIDGSWQVSVERLTLRSLSIANDVESLSQFRGIFSTPRRRNTLRRLRYHIELPPVSLKQMRKYQGRAEPTANDEAFTRSINDLFKCLAQWHADEPGFTLRVHVASPSNWEEVYQAVRGEARRMHPPAYQERNANKYIKYLASEIAPLPQVPIVSGLEYQHEDEWQQESESEEDDDDDDEDQQENADQQEIEFLWDDEVEPEDEDQPETENQQVDKYPYGKLPRSLCPSVLGHLVKALPRLKICDWGLTELPERRLLPLCLNMRSFLSESLSLARFEHLVYLHIHWGRFHYEPSNQSFEMPDHIASSNGIDELSVTLRTISQLPTLKELHLKGVHVLSPSLFTEADDDATIWPSLEVFKMELGCCTPTGDFSVSPGLPRTPYGSDVEESTGDNDSANSDEADVCRDFCWEEENGVMPTHYFRYRPDPKVLNPILIAAARAVPRMPKLRNLLLQASTTSLDMQFLAQYMSPGCSKLELLQSETGYARILEKGARDFRWLLRSTCYREYAPLHEVRSWAPDEDLRVALEKSYVGAQLRILPVAPARQRAWII